MNTSFPCSDGRRRSLFQKQRGGAWYFRVTLNGKNVWRSTERSELPAAKKIAEQMFDKVVKGEVLDANLSMDQMLQRFLDTRQVKAKHTRENDKAFANILRKSFPMQKPVRNVRTGDLLGWLNREATLRKWRGRTFNHYRLWFQQIFNLALADRLITRDEHPFGSGLIKRQRMDYVERNCPTPEQFAAIIADIRANHIGAADEIADILEFLGLAGVGQAEARALRKCDIVGGKIHFVRKKTGWPFQVPVYAWVQSLLERRCAMVEDPAAPLFTSQDCGVALRAACARLGLTQFTQRGFRQMLIVRLFDAGIPVKQIAEWQGHRDGGKLIMGIYTEVKRDTDAAAEAANLAKVTNPIRALPDPAIAA